MTGRTDDFPRGPLARRAAAALMMLPRRLTSRARRLPDFLVIGAQRGGTTSFTRCLERWSDVFVPRVKEVHYFDNAFARGADWYRAHFPLRSSAVRAVGEATPYYLFHPLAPERAHATVPGAKLIVLLRNPVDRAFSQWRHERRGGFETTVSFLEAIELEPERLAGEEERLVRGEIAFSAAHNHFGYTARGEYLRQLERWLRFFPEERMLLVRSESLFEDPSWELERVASFLGVAPGAIGDFPRYNETEAAPIEPEARVRLIEHFSSHNRALFERFGIGWDDVD